MIPNDRCSTNNAALTFVQHLIDSRFWGSISLRLEAGRVVHLYKEESLKPESLVTQSHHQKDEPHAYRNHSK
jgi:hypothetical protein